MRLKHYIIGIVIILIDQLSKFLIINKNITIIPKLLEFNYTQNAGGAFGVGTKVIVTLLSILIIIGIIIFLKKEDKNISNYIPYIMILSGSISNLINRVFRGFVIDFIDIHILNFPNFNIADMSIVMGVIILIILIMRKYNNISEKLH